MHATDFDSYLTIETMQWCQQAMTSIGHPNRPAANEFFFHGQEVVPLWYHNILTLARNHVAADAPPPLMQAPRPFVDFRKELIQQICHEYGLDPVQGGIMPEEEVER
jgi:hypothetical protein